MKQICILLIASLFFGNILKAQAIKIFHETKNQGYIIYSDNPELYPVSVLLDFKTTNLSFSEADKKVIVIPPQSQKFKLGELTVTEPGGKYKFSYTYKSAMGDVTISNYDNSINYDLPFQKGKSYKVFQGYNGKFSHQNENSLDFSMPEGSEILAARDGIVVKIVQNNTESCPTEDCKKYNNYITIMHSDGSFAAYIHIKFNGAKFKEGDSVKRGDIIALSGNTGWTSGPHLHFVSFLGGFDKWNSLETKFRVNDGRTAINLTEGSIYERLY